MYHSSMHWISIVLHCKCSQGCFHLFLITPSFFKVLWDLDPFCGATAVANPGFPLGGVDPLRAPTSDAGAFWQNSYEKERIGSLWGARGTRQCTGTGFGFRMTLPMRFEVRVDISSPAFFFRFFNFLHLATVY